MLKNYLHKHVLNQPPRTYQSLDVAQRTFFAEFTGNENATTWCLCNSIKHLACAQMPTPLGLTWILMTIPWFLCSAAALVHEKLFRGGNVETWVLQVAATATITDVYIVCCKEKLTLEAGVRRYKWLDLFTKPLVHPFIATRACPLYKRPIQFRPDIMDFDFEVREYKNAMPLLHQKGGFSNMTFYKFHWLGCLAILWILVSGALCNQFQQLLSTILGFYVIRSVADISMRAEWDNWWTP